GAEGLVAQAHPEQRGLRVERGDQLEEAAGVLGPAGTRGQDHGVGPASGQAGGRLGVRAHHLGGVAEGFYQLDQVVDERVVVVDHQDHPATAWSSADALAWVSRSSRSGSESATMPAPAWTWAWPSSTTAVRMVM